MNIEQIKRDREKKILISNGTWDRLVEAALIMEKALIDISGNSNDTGAIDCADDALDELRKP